MTKAGRLFALLEALQEQPSITGPQLAARVGVDTRTVRRDVVALHDLGIPVEAERGPAGGYRLRPGYRMPPLMLTGAEAAVIALGLLAARRNGLDAEGALAKVLRVLPDLVRMRVEALEDTLHFTGKPPSPDPPDADLVLVLADAALRGRRVAATYRTAAGAQTDRVLSPYGVVAHGGRWYAPAFDHARRELRAFRVDRLAQASVGSPGRPAPLGFDAVSFVSRTLARVPWRHEIEVLLAATPAQVAAQLPETLAELEAEGAGTRVRMRADSLDWVAGVLAATGYAFEVRRPEALRAAVHALGDRLRTV